MAMESGGNVLVPLTQVLVSSVAKVAVIELMLLNFPSQPRRLNPDSVNVAGTVENVKVGVGRENVGVGRYIGFLCDSMVRLA